MAKQRSGTDKKGRLLEEVAAQFYDKPGYTVQTRAKVPSLKTGNKREIDVLVSGTVMQNTEYISPIRLAVECKNQGTIVTVEQIDAFLGKLMDIGIPPQHGVYVTTSRYSKGARDRAKVEGVQLYTLAGLRKDRLDSLLYAAIQSVVYLFLYGTSITLRASSYDVDDPKQYAPIFFDERHELRGMAYDLLWRAWRLGQLPHSLGSHEVPIEIPAGWFHYMPDGTPDPETALSAGFDVVGVVLTFPGQSCMHSLHSGYDDTFESGQVRVEFGDNPPLSRIQVFETEDALRTALREQDRDIPIRLTLGRYPAPRIRVGGQFGSLYWPPSECAVRRMAALIQEYGPNPPPLPHDSIDEHDFPSVWEPIWKDYPLATQ